MRGADRLPTALPCSVNTCRCSEPMGPEVVDHVRESSPRTGTTPSPPPVRARRHQGRRPRQRRRPEIRSFRGLIDHLATLTRATVAISSTSFDKISGPSPVQRCAFDPIRVTIPLTRHPEADRTSSTPAANHSPSTASTYLRTRNFGSGNLRGDLRVTFTAVAMVWTKGGYL